LPLCQGLATPGKRAPQVPLAPRKARFVRFCVQKTVQKASRVLRRAPKHNGGASRLQVHPRPRWKCRRPGAWPGKAQGRETGALTNVTPIWDADSRPARKINC